MLLTYSCSRGSKYEGEIIEKLLKITDLFINLYNVNLGTRYIKTIHINTFLHWPKPFLILNCHDFKTLQVQINNQA